MQLFYDPGLREGTHQLRAEEAAHAVRVLRKRVGDTLDLVDGRGGWYKGKILEAGKRDCYLEVTRTGYEEQRAPHHLTLLLAPTKQIDRLEWALEKATEIGVDVIQPFVGFHSERKRLRADRLEKILEAAMKQSLRAWKPELRELLPFDDALRGLPAHGQRLLAYLGGRDTPMLHQVANPGGSTVLAIGPEGGFSPEEAEVASSLGFAYVSLGPHRLRTETAAVAAVHTINQLNW